MADLTDVAPIIQYTAEGGETSFEFPFLVYESAHLVVLRTVGGVATILNEGVDFTTSGLEEEDGGSITLDGTLYPSGATAGHIYTLYREVPIATFFTFSTAGDFLANSVNKNGNLILQVLQQLERDIGRSMTLDIDSSVTDLRMDDPVANQILAWNGAANRVVNYDPTGLAQVLGTNVTAVEIQSGQYLTLSGVAGTDTITAGLTPTLTTYTDGQVFVLTPQNANTGATTININSLGAKNLFSQGAACVGGELVAGAPCLVVYLSASDRFDLLTLPGLTSVIAELNILDGVTANAAQINAAAASSGSFTATLTGMTAATTGTINWEKHGNIVTMWAASAIEGTSNTDSTLTMTGLPAAVTPSANRWATCYGIRDNGNYYFGAAEVGSNSVISFNISTVSGSQIEADGTFTNSGAKGLRDGWVINYPA